MSSDDLLSSFARAINPEAKLPWDSIVDFATHPYFCGLSLYPRQKTLLKLMWLETEHLTPYDLDVIDEWRQGFGHKFSVGVPHDIFKRIEVLREQGYQHFSTVVAVQGRRGSKGVIGGINGAAKVGQLVALDNPQQFFGIAPNKDIYVNVLATSLTQAKKNLFNDVATTIENCQWLQPQTNERTSETLSVRTPYDDRYTQDLAHRIGKRVDREIATIKVKALATRASSGRGQASIVNMFDEFGFVMSGTGSEMTSEEVWASYSPALRQFGTHALSYIPSSPWTKTGQLYALYQQGAVVLGEYQEQSDTFDLQNDPSSLWRPDTLVVQLPSSNLYKDWDKSPELGGPMFTGPLMVEAGTNTPEEIIMHREKVADPQKYKVEYESQFAEVIDAYLDPVKVDEAFGPWQGELLTQNLESQMRYQYHAHVDPSATNANFALCIGHLEDGEPDEMGIAWPHAIIDYTHVWKPTDFPDNTIDYIMVERELEGIIRKFPSMVEFTADQFQSISMLSRLRSAFTKRAHLKIREETATEKANTARFEKFKAAINLGWVRFPEDEYFEGDSLLKNELKFMQLKNGRVEKQSIGPVQTKDLADAASVTVVRMLEDQLDNWHNLLGETKLVSKAVAPPNTLKGRALGIHENMGVSEKMSRMYGNPRNRYASPSRGRRR